MNMKMGIEAALRICFLLFLLSASWQDLKKKTIKKSTFQIWGTVGVILQAAHIFSQIFMGTEKMEMQVIVQEVTGLMFAALLGILLLSLSTATEEAMGKGDGCFFLVAGIFLGFWKNMLLLSGGIDSPVAGFMVAKRGVKIDAVYFHAPPYTSERAKQKVVDLAKLVARYSGPIYLHVINFTEIQLAIYEKCPHDELTIIMRRYMMKIAEDIAKKTECLGLITGESIGQVASQTIQSLAVTNEVCTLPVFRPCIGLDKQEIVEISEKIGTYETSILPFEDCCTIFVAKHPVTKPNLAVIKRHEENLKDCIDEMMQRALDTEELIVVEAQ